MKLTGLWRHTEFKKLWAGQAISLFGSQVWFIALPLTAVVVLDASPIEMGVVTAMFGVPAVFGIYLGVWADRRKRLPVIVASDIARALLLAAIPVAHFMDVLSMGMVYVVAFGMGAMSMLFQIAYRSFLPSVVKQDELVEANSKLEFATSGAGAIGPAAGGFLVQAITASFAMLFGSGLFVLSALFFRRIRVSERDPGSSGTGSSGGGIKEGFNFFRSNRLLVGIAGSQTHVVIFSSAFEAINILYMVRVLGLSAGTIGVIFAVSSAGLFLGALVSSKLSVRIGIGRLATVGLIAAGLGDLAVPIAGGPALLVAVVIITGGIMTEAGIVLYNIGQVSIKQAVTPDHLQGRVTAILVVLSRAGVPIGGLLGGIMGEVIGLRTSLFIAGAGMATAGLWLLFLRVWAVRSLTRQAEQPAV